MFDPWSETTLQADRPKAESNCCYMMKGSYAPDRRAGCRPPERILPKGLERAGAFGRGSFWSMGRHWTDRG